ncbi:hypothetical protein OIU79_003673 [Salix purpurea]|uniref:Uncharacterized protein n=1 Tax=Salix purpurea TaxID=77065 RepID=A0A9Q0NHP0_SALPP|nr:hypothetical protein OIU79_003673 [Salix purpurea]
MNHNFLQDQATGGSCWPWF